MIFNFNRSGHLFIPASLLAFSLFSKKKDEVQEAIDKLKVLVIISISSVLRLDMGG